MIKLTGSQKSLILITGIPASGKTYFSKQLNQILNSQDKQCLILSIDKIQAIIQEKSFKNQDSICDEIINLLMQNQWGTIMKQFELNKAIFNSEIWKKSRQIAEDYKLIDFLMNKCDILIVQDEKPLRSQRKSFKKYCYVKGLKYLQIQLLISVEQALQNNNKRQYKQSVSEQIIRKSYQKFQHNVQSLKFQPNSKSFLLEKDLILSNLKSVHIQDSYSEFLNKQLKNSSKIHESTENQLDENQLRKLISQILNDQKTDQQYFPSSIFKQKSKKQKAQLLACTKKIYIKNKRLKSFKDVFDEYIQKINKTE